jgi:hypothetical protein
MHFIKTLKYRQEVGNGFLNRPLSPLQRSFDEQAPTASSGSGPAAEEIRKLPFDFLADVR